MNFNKNKWVLSIAVIFLIYAVYHLRKDLKHQEKKSENTSFTFEERQTTYQRENLKFFGTWAQKRENQRSKVISVKDFLNEKEAISSEVKAEQEKVLSQLNLRNAMHAHVSNSYVQARVFKNLSL